MNVRRIQDTKDFVEVAGIIGISATERLCEAIGGVRTYIPRHIGHNHPISAAIGAALARELADHRYGTTIDLPKAHLRRQRVIELSERGDMTLREIALATDYTERQVRRILDSAREDDGQMSIFDLLD